MATLEEAPETAGAPVEVETVGRGRSMEEVGLG
jgi:hypothetical protein